MARIKSLLAIAVLAAALPVAAQPDRLYECTPFVKNGRGYYFVEPIAHIGQYGAHFAWACKDPGTDAVRSYIYFCSLDVCNPVQLARSLWLITSGQSTAAKEWAQYATIPTPVPPDSPNYPLALEAQEIFNQLKDRVAAKEAE